MNKTKAKDSDAFNISHSLVKELNKKNFFLSDIFNYMAYNYNTIYAINSQRKDIAKSISMQTQEERVKAYAHYESKTAGPRPPTDRKELL